jgi:hypothetical protein
VGDSYAGDLLCVVLKNQTRIYGRRLDLVFEILKETFES